MRLTKNLPLLFGALFILTAATGAAHADCLTLVYPAAAKQAREEGTVTVEVQFSRDGQVQDARIKESSGFPDLDDATLIALTKVSCPLAPPAKGKPAATPIWTPMKIVWKLDDSAPGPAPLPAAEPPPPPAATPAASGDSDIPLYEPPQKPPANVTIAHVDPDKGCSRDDPPHMDGIAVVLAYLIDAQGKVVRGEIHAPSNMHKFDREVLAWFGSHCSFVPGSIDGKPASSWVVMNYTTNAGGLRQ